MIIQALIVMPPCIRSANLREGMIGSDGYGTLYKTIVKEYNKFIYAADQGDKDLAAYTIQIAITTLIIGYDSHRLPIPESFKPIKERIQDKNKGVIRGMTQGKRVNFTARTVAGPDPSLKFNQVGLPEEWRKALTREIVVTNFNRDSIVKMLNPSDPNQPVTITHITFSQGERRGRQIRVTESNRGKLNVVPGDKVTRWGQDGDMVLLNRQPTIHKQGMMGHEAIFMPGRTVRIPLGPTSAYNADFDGDELNVHAVQTIEGAIDIMGKMDVRNCILNAQDNKPLMGPVMDSLTSAYILTQDDVLVDNDLWDDMMMLITANDSLPSLEDRLQKRGMGRTPDASDNNIEKYSGKALFSALLPEDFYYKKSGVIVWDGILVSGVITKSTLGTTHNSIVQVMYKKYGSHRVVDFLSDAPKILERWLSNRGFSIGLSDCFPTNERHRQIIREEVAKTKIQVQQMGVKLNDPLEEARREREIIARLGQTKDIGGRISEESLTPMNAINVMTRSGAKGSVFNTAQITGLLGQQFVEGGRIPNQLMGGRRSLAYFEPDSLDPE